MVDSVAWFSLLIIPMFVLVVLVIATAKRLPTFDLFVEGSKEGLTISLQLLPYLVGMYVSISIFRQSGALEAFVEWLTPFFVMINVPSDVIPLALLRPISGTAALALTTDLLKTMGPDSVVGRLVSTMQGSTDTTFYILTVYFGSVGIKKFGDALKVGLLADLIGIITAIIVVKFFFGI
ncbi:spore maturation protein B [Pelagirhabdus alkalitolerans]|uniref:Spore maturation protein B n=1 Tax=Pelagirhabdus alkalitolerans TaxID=1612202 RepID=A0A1G6HDY4_9BACI|nr:nucleoside recognition domain-containing protein [Pelagirhabdus alkalitolerans]SDB91636.1 spore maturation protein B [Pelagirhabdus alkalitolerans]